MPAIPSYAGYDGLGRNLASHGMVVVSIGANGINANDGFLDDGGASARAQLILEHLRRWRTWDADAGASPFGARFVGHIDLDRVGLMGHSRGGEGIAAAVQLNQRSSVRFGIRAAFTDKSGPSGVVQFRKLIAHWFAPRKCIHEAHEETRKKADSLCVFVYFADRIFL